MDSKNPLTIPMAIVVAGGLIAGAIFLKGNANLGPKAVQERPAVVAQPAETGAMPLRPIDANRDHIRGNPNANIVIVEFSDPECPFCERFHRTMQKVIETYGRSGSVAWVYREYPIPQLHSKAPKEAEAFECAGELGGNAKFWEYADRLFAVTKSNDSLDPAMLPRIAVEVGLDEARFNECLSSGRQQARIQEDRADGEGAGVDGTPHSVFVLKAAVSNKNKESLLTLMEPLRDPYGNLPISFSLDGLRVGLNGALPLDIIKQVIDTLLK